MVSARKARPRPGLALVPRPSAEALLEEGRWSEARALLEALPRPTSDDLRALAEACWWSGDIHTSVATYRRAFAASRREGNDYGAIGAALSIAITYRCFLANDVVAGGWVARAQSIASEGRAPELQAAIWAVHCHVIEERDPVRSHELAVAALAEARRVGDRDTEILATAALGLKAALAGDVEGGLALVDEAMAAVSAREYTRRETVVFVSCIMLGACLTSAEVERADGWVRVAHDFMQTLQTPFFFAECRALYGGLLVVTGRWPEAELQLHSAIELSRGRYPSACILATAGLADLRLRQGRIEECSALLDGIEHESAAAVVSARLSLARGEAAVARAAAERLLRRRGLPALPSARALAVLVDACLALDDGPASSEALRRLQTLRSAASNEVHGRASFAAARVAAARGEASSARDAFEDAIDAFTAAHLPHEAASARLALAAVLAPADQEAAVIEARAALAACEALGAGRDADAAAALLRTLGVRSRPAPRGDGGLTAREREVLALLGSGLSNPEIAARLVISRKTAAHHVSAVLAKLALRNRAEAVAYVARTLVPSGPAEAPR